MYTNKGLMPVGLALFLVGCGGGGGGAAGPAADPPPATPPADASPAGHWFGFVTNDASGVTEEYVAMADAGGRFRFVSVDSAVQLSGNLLISTDAVSGSGMAFADAGVVWQDGSTATAATIHGSIRERSSLSGTWTTVSGESGSFDFLYDGTFYERAATLEQLAGSWTVYDDLGNPQAAFTILADGSFSAQNDSGCTSSGQFAVIDAGANLFEVQSTISGCPIAGEYVGLAFLVDLFVSNDALVFAVDNGERAVVLGLEK